LRSDLIACVFAALGALGGGVLMYLWGARDYEHAAHLVEKVPAISTNLMHEVQQQMRQEGTMAVAIGPFVGLPYKVYAVEASRAGIALPAFAAITVPARLSRFLLLTLLSGLASRAVHGRIVLRWRYAVSPSSGSRSTFSTGPAWSGDVGWTCSASCRLDSGLRKRIECDQQAHRA